MAPSLISILILIAVHLTASRMRFLDVVPRSRWLSAAGGVSVAYVFVHLMPELAASQEHFRSLFSFRWLDRHVYLLSLFGLCFFYGLERQIRQHRNQKEEEEKTDNGIFFLHMASFTIYNSLIGFLIARYEEPLFWFVIAMALHFIVTDFGLRHDHPQTYLRVGRWVVSGGILLGWTLGMLPIQLPVAVVAAITAFLGGGVIMNVLKEELPHDRQSRFWAFALGAVVYAALLIAI